MKYELFLLSGISSYIYMDYSLNGWLPSSNVSHHFIFSLLLLYTSIYMYFGACTHKFDYNRGNMRRWQEFHCVMKHITDFESFASLSCLFPSLQNKKMSTCLCVCVLCACHSSGISPPSSCFMSHDAHLITFSFLPLLYIYSQWIRVQT